MRKQAEGAEAAVALPQDTQHVWDNQHFCAHSFRVLSRLTRDMHQNSKTTKTWGFFPKQQKKSLAFVLVSDWDLKMSLLGESWENGSLKIHKYVSKHDYDFFLTDTVHFWGTIQSRIASNFKSLRQAMLFLNPFNTKYRACQIKSEEIHYTYISLSVAK